MTCSAKWAPCTRSLNYEGRIMGRLTDDAWGDAAVSWPDRFFQIRVANESDTARLEAAVVAEANGPARKERIARLNSRLATVRKQE